MQLTDARMSTDAKELMVGRSKNIIPLTLKYMLVVWVTIATNITAPTITAKRTEGMQLILSTVFSHAIEAEQGMHY
jgi:hypothetical protein